MVLLGRVRWKRLARLVAGVLAGAALVALVPTLLREPQPQPLDGDIGFTGVKPAARASDEKAVAPRPGRPVRSSRQRQRRPADRRQAPPRRHPAGHGGPARSPRVPGTDTVSAPARSETALPPAQPAPPPTEPVSAALPTDAPAPAPAPAPVYPAPAASPPPAPAPQSPSSESSTNHSSQASPSPEFGFER